MKLLFLCISSVIGLSVLAVTASDSEDALGKDEKCKEDPYNVCASKHSVQSVTFPGSESDIDTNCEIYLPFLECWKKEHDDCSDHFDKWKVDFSNFVKEVCKKDSHLRKSIVENLTCLKKEWQKEKVHEVHTCFLLEDETAIRIKEYFTAKGESSIEEWMFNCPARYIKTACFINSIKECGNNFLEVAIENSKTYDFWEDNAEGCPRERTMEAVEKMKGMQLEIHVENLLHYAVRLTEKN